MKQPTRVVESHEVSRNGSRVCGAVVSGCSACTLECGVVPGMRSCARLDVVPTPSYVCYTAQLLHSAGWEALAPYSRGPTISARPLAHTACLEAYVMASPICWSRLLAVGSKEAEPYRKVDLSTPQTLIGRKDGCHEKISDNTVSSVHCRITLVQLSDEVLLDEDHQSALEVWLEDTSANGTYVNMQKVGKGNRVRLSQNDEIGLIRPCGGGERPPWAFIFQDFSADLSAAEIHAVFHGGGAPTAAVAAAVPAAAEVTPRDAHSVPATPRVDAPPVLPLAAPPAPAGAGAARPLQPLGAGVKFEHSAALANPLMSSMRILAAPDPKGLRELRGTMRRGALNMGEFISADGPSALLDVISEVVAKPCAIPATLLKSRHDTQCFPTPTPVPSSRLSLAQQARLDRPRGARWRPRHAERADEHARRRQFSADNGGCSRRPRLRLDAWRGACARQGATHPLVPRRVLREAARRDRTPPGQSIRRRVGRPVAVRLAAS